MNEIPRSSRTSCTQTAWATGPPESCDGYRYRGRGLIRIIGRANYASAGAALGVDLESQPESLLEPRNAAMSAAWIWSVQWADFRPHSFSEQFSRAVVDRAIVTKSDEKYAEFIVRPETRG